MADKDGVKVKVQSNLLMGFCLLIFSIVYYMITYHFSGVQFESVQGDIGPAFFPRLFLGALIIESLFLILSSVRDLLKLPKDNARFLHLFQRIPFIILAAFILYMVLTFFVGYLISTIPFLILAFYLLGLRTVWQLVTIPPALTFATYYLFQELLGVYLPTGDLF